MVDPSPRDDVVRALERLHEAQRIGRIGDWDFDLDAGVITWSPQVYEIMGRDPALGPPTTYDEMASLFDADSAARLREHVDLAVRTGRSQSYELELDRGGQRLHLQARAVPRTDPHGRVLSLGGTIQDVTARDTAERLVAESEQRLGFALEAAEIGDWDMDLRTNVARRSLQHDQCFGYTAPVPEWGYDTFLAHVDEQHRARVDASFQRAMAGRGDYDVEFRTTWPDGSTHWLWSRGRFYFDETGAPYRVAGIQVDVTERRREVEAAIRLAAIVESSEDAIISQDRAGVVVTWNPGAERLFGHTAESMLGQGLEQLGAPDAPGDERRWFDLAAGGEAVAPFETTRRRADGAVLDVVLTLSPLRDVDGQVVGVSTIARDIGDRKRLELSLRHQAMHDALTGLPNRALLDDRMQHALSTTRSLGTRVVVLFLDLDRFKVLNDAEGHGAGDAVLVEVARRLRTTVRPQDTVARFGGDEFVVLCETGGLAAAHHVAERLHASLAQPFLGDGEPRFIAASIGIAVADADSTAGDLLRDADAAMYRAKDLGRGRTALFDPDIRARAAARLEATTALRRALGAGELTVHYQPVVDIADEHLLGFEALVRWQHPEHGLLGPGAFIPEAEESGFVVALGEWVLDTALEQCGRWVAEGRAASPPHVAVNLSARQLEEPDLARGIAAALARTGFPADALSLEITESVVMRDVLRNVEQLRELREIGVDLSVDDFGTGYSSLVYLKRLPVTTLKVDREFVDGLGQDPHDSAIVAAVIALARALELRVVAEGVETPRQLAELRRLGCDAAQGYLFSRPLPADEAALWVLHGRAPAPVPHGEGPGTTGADPLPRV